MFYQICIPIPHTQPHSQEIYVLSGEESPWCDVGIGDGRDTSEDCLGGLHFLSSS